MWEDDNNNNNIDNIKLNKKFAQKFEQRKKREEVEKAKTKYGGKELNKMLDDEGSYSESSSSASEDEQGELLTDKERVNFIKTIAKIREKDPEIYKNTNFWSDEIFDKETAAGKKEKQNPVYYKDLARQALTDDNKPKKTVRELHDEEQGELKKAFKMAAEDNDGDDLFKVKEKTLQQIEDENKEFDKFIKTESKKSKPEELDMLQRFWGDETKLDDTDKFLRKYIMTNGWIDKDQDQFDFGEADEEDERRDDEMDEFEEKYNFRFEEPGADQVVTHGREVQDSVRQKDDKRKEKRKEKEERRKEELREEQENLKRLKGIMKQEVLDRLKKVQEIAGSELANKEKFNKILDKDFDPKDYDQLMNEEFGEGYYDNEDMKEEELDEYVEQREKEEDEVPEDKKDDEEPKKEEAAAKNGKQSKADADQETLLQPKAAIPIYNRVGIKEQEAKEIADSIGHLWWYCDTCFKGIREGEARYECLECQDFCQCKKCADMKDHPHKMKKFVVPQGCAPPSDKEIQKILEQQKFCAECSYKFTGFDFINELKKNTEFLLCEDCMKSNQKQYKEKDFNRIKPTQVDGDQIAKGDLGKLKEMYEDQELHNLIDSYYALDFEDVISGGLKTRFKYINVAKNSYGLTDDELLFADDKVLGQFVSVKKIQPYRPDNGEVNMKVLRKKKNLVKKDAERNLKDVTKDVRKLERLEESGLSKAELQEARKHTNELRAMIDKKKKKKRVKLLSEKDIEGLDDQEANEEEPEEDFEPEKEKKRKLNSSRLKSYGLE